MAKIKFGAGIADARGSIDSMTFSRSRYGAYIRKKVTPVNTATPAQAAARSLFGAASSGFRSLGAAAIDAWNLIAPEYQRSNIFGDNLPLSGATLFTKLKTQLTAVGYLVDPSPISPVTVPNVTIDGVTADKSADTLVVEELAATGSGQVIAVYATAPFSAGRTFVARNQYRLIDTKPVSQAAGDFDVSTGYQNYFGGAIGAAPVGAKVGIMVKYVNLANGQAGPELRFTTTVVA